MRPFRYVRLGSEWPLPVLPHTSHFRPRRSIRTTSYISELIRCAPEVRIDPRKLSAPTLKTFSPPALSSPFGILASVILVLFSISRTISSLDTCSSSLHSLSCPIYSRSFSNDFSISSESICCTFWSNGMSTVITSWSV